MKIATPGPMGSALRYAGVAALGILTCAFSGKLLCTSLNVMNAFLALVVVSSVLLIAYASLRERLMRPLRRTAPSDADQAPSAQLLTGVLDDGRFSPTAQISTLRSRE